MRLWGRRRRFISTIAFIMAIVIGIGALAISPHRTHHPGGDPGGRLIANMVAIVRVVPGFEQGTIPWDNAWCDSCKIPDTYALKIEPHWDNCNGIASTAGWDPAAVQIGLVSTETQKTLDATLGTRLDSLRWTTGLSPSWAKDQSPDPAWNFPNNDKPIETLKLDPDVYPNHWMILIEGEAVGRLVDCSRQ